MSRIMPLQSISRLMPRRKPVISKATGNTNIASSITLSSKSQAVRSSISTLSTRRLWSHNVSSSYLRSFSTATNPNSTTTTSTPEASAPLKKTPLYGIHVAHKAKLVPFAGYTMPLLYPSHQSHVESHNWTRTNASLFDVSHMVQHIFRGPDALEFLESATPSDLRALGNNRGTLSALLNGESGGIVDDCIITKREEPREFYVVTNAACAEKDLAFFDYHKEDFLTSRYKDEFEKGECNEKVEHEVLGDYGLVALQGPQAQEILQGYLDEYSATSKVDLADVIFGDVFKVQVPASDQASAVTPMVTLHISRGGYTGEDGFEISIPPGPDGSTPTFVTEEILKIGTPKRVQLAGLAARDSLRLEAGLCLYGHDLNEEVTPVQAGLSWIIGKRRRRGKFPGSKVITTQFKDQAKKGNEEAKGKSGGTPYRFRVGIMMDEGQGIVREGTKIVVPGENIYEVGVVTSGGPAPSLGMRAIAMGYVDDSWNKVGTELGFLVRGRMKIGRVVQMPFVPTKYYRGKD